MASIISASTTSGTALNISADTTGVLQLATGATPTTAVTIDTSQNVGIGVTPSAWATSSAIQMVGGQSYSKYGITNNAYYDGTNYKYISTAAATLYGNSGGGHLWFNAPSGTAGTNITFTQAMTLDNSGVVTIANLAGTGSRTVTASATGVLSAASDSSLKQEDTSHIIEGLNAILQLKPRAYKWLDDIENRGDEATTEIGFFADEVASIIPSAAPKGQDEIYGFYDRAVIAALTKAIQEQQTLIVSQSELINSLTARVTALEAK